MMTPGRAHFRIPGGLFRSKWQRVLCLGLIFIVGMLATVYHLSFSRKNDEFTTMSPCVKVPGDLPLPITSDHLRYEPPSAVTGRTDVVTVTPWLAPIVWDSTFNGALLDAIYMPRDITIATTVFAVGEYVRFLKDFLETAERHFFVGFKVHYYVFTDRPDQVPSVDMATGREVFIRPAQNHRRWQEIGAGRFKVIADFIETELHGRANYVFCFDVDAKFHSRWGPETLGRLVAALHPDWYGRKRHEFSYERRPASKAFMSADEGDFYYPAGAYGGELPSVHHMLTTCNDNFQMDAQQGIEAAWQEESHLNKYLWLYKPSVVLCPEYMWRDGILPTPPNIKMIRFSGVVKDYTKIRPGWPGSEV